MGASSEKSLRNLQGTLNDLAKKIEEAGLTLGDIEAGKRKLAAENGDLLHQLQELENSTNMLAKSKLSSEIESMADQLDQAQILNSSMEKKAKQFDRIVGEWKGKVDSFD